MKFLLVLLCTIVLCILCKEPLKKVPWVFYILALVLAGTYAVSSYVTYPQWFLLALMFLMQKGTLATAIFVVVMFIGVFDGFDYVRKHFKPIRAVISIIGCILILGHIVKYLVAFIPRLDAYSTILQSGFWLALLLFLIMIPLGVTSFQAIKKKMSAASWLKLQKSAYVFYGLLYVHLMLMLAPAALKGSATAVESVVIYSVIFLAYAILRTAKAIRDNKAKAAKAGDEGANAEGANVEE